MMKINVMGIQDNISNLTDLDKLYDGVKDQKVIKF
jgi:hypothetical protein